jgi:hypothetical protein
LLRLSGAIVDRSLIAAGESTDVPITIDRKCGLV